MPGPLTAADDYDFEDFGVSPDGLGGDDVEDVSVDESPYGVDISGGIADLTPVYDAAIQRLKAQRSGLSGRERLGALLVGFGQPTRHGKWQESVGNAAQLLFQQSVAQKRADEARRLKLEQMMTQRDVAGIRTKALIKAAELKAAAAKGPGKLNADEKQRLGYAKIVFPGKTDEEYMEMLYDPKVTAQMKRAGIAANAASQGLDPEAALEAFDSAVAPPKAAPVAPPIPADMTVAQLLKEARAALAKGAPREAVVQRLRAAGISTEGL